MLTLYVFVAVYLDCVSFIGFWLLFAWVFFLLVNSHSMQYRHTQSTVEPLMFVSAIFTRRKENPSYLMNSHK